MPDQVGAALVIAVLILLVISIISVTGASRSVLEEQMSSNQYIQTNTFLAAEAGISQVRQKVINNVDVRQDLADAPNKVCNPYTDTGWTRVSDTKSSAEFCLQLVQNNDDDSQSSEHATNEVFRLLSHGRTKMGDKTLSQRTLGVAIRPAGLSKSSGSSPFISAIIGRQGVSITGGSLIDTYNSSYGSYAKPVTADGQEFVNSTSSSNSGDLNGAVARTCAADATITLSGYVPIYGDVLGTGDLVASSGTPVHGSIHVNGNAQFNAHVDGDLIVGGNVYIGSASKIGGTVTAGGNVELTGGSDGKPKKIRAGGTIDYPADYPASLTDSYIENVSASELAIAPVDKKEAGCAPSQESEPGSYIAKKFSSARNDSRTQPLVKWLENHQCSLESCYQMADGGINLIGHGNGSNNGLTVGSSGKQAMLQLSSGDLSTTGNLAEIHIEGYVILLVDGDFNLGDRTTLTLGTTGTLTLLVTGHTTFNGGSNTSVAGSFVRPGADGEPAPAIAVYSTYASSSSSDIGITIGGWSDAHIAVYAPDTAVNIDGSGDIYGSVVAQNIDMSGSGKIHYDEALQKVTTGEGDGSSSGEPSKAQIVGWWQE